jgi:hypothetical protein
VLAIAIRRGGGVTMMAAARSKHKERIRASFARKTGEVVAAVLDSGCKFKHHSRGCAEK